MKYIFDSFTVQTVGKPKFDLFDNGVVETQKFKVIDITEEKYERFYRATDEAKIKMTKALLYENKKVSRFVSIDERCFELVSEWKKGMIGRNAGGTKYGR